MKKENWLLLFLFIYFVRSSLIELKENHEGLSSKDKINELISAIKKVNKDPQNIIKGKDNKVLGKDNVVVGHSNEAHGKKNQLFGNLNKAEGVNNFAEGNKNNLKGLHNTAFGNGNKIEGIKNEF